MGDFSSKPEDSNSNSLQTPPDEDVSVFQTKLPDSLEAKIDGKLASFSAITHLNAQRKLAVIDQVLLSPVTTRFSLELI